ncbi:putative ATP-dependent RNA helicase Dbp73D [Amphibalanus amphitrite]|uniref:Putative ATP-dependent RNA helicase Dbp73D n=1 Tax=Amphibalanus amphitrite TaxID=1232801 RepID=A0A6A4X7U6_AMPAM|nr:putative ATP-dependent RNA helicase Dbp73D [Amphibalanus amphitrite]
MSLFQPRLLVVGTAATAVALPGQFVGRFTTPAELSESFNVVAPQPLKPLLMYHLLRQPDWRRSLVLVNWNEVAHQLELPLSVLGARMTEMLLVLGDSYAHRFRSICDAGDSITASGWRGACVGDDEFRRWAIREAVLRRPQRVFLMVGSNDLARPLQDMISGMIRSALASASSVPEAATGPAPTPASGAPEASTGPATAPDAVLRLAAAAAVPTTTRPQRGC